MQDLPVRGLSVGLAASSGRCVVHVSNPNTKEQLAAHLAKIRQQELVVHQKTPIRVLHR